MSTDTTPESQEYTPEAWRMEGYYPESYAKFRAALGIGIDYSDSDFDRYEGEFRADLAVHYAARISHSMEHAIDLLDSANPYRAEQIGEN